MNYTSDWIARWATYSPKQIAVKEWKTGRSLMYGELNKLGNALARHFQSLGFRCGDRIGILAENCLEYVVLFAAAQKSGLILVPMNYRLAAGEIAYLVGKSAPRLLITSSSCEPLLTEIPQDAVQHLSLRALRMWLTEALNAPEVKPQLQAFPENHPIFILFTSGTTGFPKGAIYSHKMLLWNSLNTLMRLDLSCHDRTVMCMPLFHTGGWNVLLTPLLHLGGTCCLMQKFEADQVLQALAQEKATIFMGVPTMLKMLAEQAAFEQMNWDELRYIVVGGEAMPIPLIERWAQKGIAIRQGYGMTEVGPNLFSLYQDDALRKKGSIGQPNFYVEAKIVDTKGEIVPPNTAGELLLNGPMVTPGYWQDESATAKSFDNGWFKTGDMLVCDDEGYYFVVDRIKHMFISGGENVYPAEIERVLLQHPAIAEAAVIAVPDPKWGEVGKAILVWEGEGSFSAEELKAFCEGKLARFKIPKYWELVEALPKNATGKIDRKGLASYYQVN